MTKITENHRTRQQFGKSYSEQYQLDKENGRK